MFGEEYPRGAIFQPLNTFSSFIHALPAWTNMTVASIHDIPLCSRGAVPGPGGGGGGGRSGGRLSGHYLQQLVQGCRRVRHLVKT